MVILTSRSSYLEKTGQIKMYYGDLEGSTIVYPSEDYIIFAYNDRNIFIKARAINQLMHDINRKAKKSYVGTDEIRHAFEYLCVRLDKLLPDTVLIRKMEGQDIWFDTNLRLYKDENNKITRLMHTADDGYTDHQLCMASDVIYCEKCEKVIDITS